MQASCCVITYVSFTWPFGHNAHVTWRQQKMVLLVEVKTLWTHDAFQRISLDSIHTMLGRICYSLKRMFDILEPYWRGGMATKRGRMSTRWQGWASRYECDVETWFVGAAARCRCSWLQWPCRELETPTRAPACTGGPPVRRMRRNNVIL